MKIEIKIVPDGLDPAKEIQDGMPVDMMKDACPVATQDIETNEENQRMVEEINLSTKQTERDAAKLIVDESDNGIEIQAKQQEQSSD